MLAVVWRQYSTANSHHLIKRAVTAIRLLTQLVWRPHRSGLLVLYHAGTHGTALPNGTERGAGRPWRLYLLADAPGGRIQYTEHVVGMVSYLVGVRHAAVCRMLPVPGAAQRRVSNHYEHNRAL
jgi:hypothetical protein